MKATNDDSYEIRISHKNSLSATHSLKDSEAFGQNKIEELVALGCNKA